MREKFLYREKFPIPLLLELATIPRQKSEHMTLSWPITVLADLEPMFPHEMPRVRLAGRQLEADMPTELDTQIELEVTWDPQTGFSGPLTLGAVPMPSPPLRAIDSPPCLSQFDLGF